MNNRLIGRILRWIGIFGAIALVIGGLAWIGSQQDAALSGRALSEEVQAEDWSKGDENAPITIVEYSDFQCPTCAAFFPVMNRLLDDYSGQIRVVYRHFPLSAIHPNAEEAAMAAEAAGKQGKFWEMHDLIFNNQDIWSAQRDPWPAFENYASQIGLNLEQFQSDVASDDVEDAVSHDYTTGLSSGVQGTPTFYLNGEVIPTLPQGYPGFKAIIDTKLQELNVTAPTDDTSESTESQE